MTEKNNSKIAEFESAMKKLRHCVDKLDSGETTLEESISLYQQAITYHKQCMEILELARHTVELYDAKADTVTEFGEGK